MLDRVIDTSDERILEGNAPPGLLRIFPNGSHQIGKWIALAYRYQTITHLVIRSVKGNGQVDGQTLAGEAAYAGYQTDSRKGNPPRSQVVSPLMGQGFDGLPGCGIVGQWFSHAHQHNVGHGMRLGIGLDPSQGGHLFL